MTFLFQGRRQKKKKVEGYRDNACPQEPAGFAMHRKMTMTFDSLSANTQNAMLLLRQYKEHSLVLVSIITILFQQLHSTGQCSHEQHIVTTTLLSSHESSALVPGVASLASRATPGT